MTFEAWLAFAVASAALVLIPGPTVLLVVSYALGQGWRAALPMAVGVALGDFTAMTISVMGLGAMLAASATAFTIVRWAGAAYLVWLGAKLFRAGSRLDVEAREGRTPPARMLAHAWLVTSLNPKSITFFVAFFPQFLDSRLPLLPQAIVLEGTFLILALANALGYAYFANRARRLVCSERIVGAINRTGGVLLIGAGAAAAAIDAPR